MNYLIDANNLAGKIGILDEEDFDMLLVEKISKWLGDKQKKIILVFDSLEKMGDKRIDGEIISIYTPRDEYYNNADDKIIEITREWEDFIKDQDIKINKSLFELLDKEGLTFVSDDIDLTNKIEKVREEGVRVKIIKNDIFLDILDRKTNKESEDGDRDLESDEIKKINDELLEKWT
ncbi:hypothetical protein C0583_06095 [Candidatus Parcubacteria bacterium]|nr:MAG: hypothetical protein C0583_06095 [Candidatus Parcubacteria bacterium]